MNDELKRAADTFTEAISDMESRLSAVEVVSRLWTRPLEDYANVIDRKALEKWLQDKVDEPPVDYGYRWTKSYANEYEHIGAGVTLKIPDSGYSKEDQRKLLRVILIIAAVESMTPVQLVNEFQSGLIHVIDSLADVVDD